MTDDVDGITVLNEPAVTVTDEPDDPEPIVEDAGKTDVPGQNEPED